MKNPKEDGFAKGITANYDGIEVLQAEKVALSEKAMIVVCRHQTYFHSPDH